MKSGFTSLGYPGSQKDVSFLESNLQSVQIGKKKLLLKEKKKKTGCCHLVLRLFGLGDIGFLPPAPAPEDRGSREGCLHPSCRGWLRWATLKGIDFPPTPSATSKMKAKRSLPLALAARGGFSGPNLGADGLSQPSRCRVISSYSSWGGRGDTSGYVRTKAQHL